LIEFWYFVEMLDRSRMGKSSQSCCLQRLCHVRRLNRLDMYAVFVRLIITHNALPEKGKVVG